MNATRSAQASLSDEEIVQANVIRILANPEERFPDGNRNLTAIELIKAGIESRLKTVREHRSCYGESPNAWSREVTTRLKWEIQLMEKTLKRVLEVQGDLEPSFRDAWFRHDMVILSASHGWPRLKVPETKATLLASTELGKQVAALLDTETPLVGVDAGKIRPDLVKIAVVTRLTKDTLNLSLTAGWGHGGKGGVTMPGKGKLETRAFTAEELAAFSVTQVSSPPQSQKKTESSGRQDARPTLLGQSTHDVYLNESTCWRNVPEKVWEYTIGGYQVIKKWLSYREFDLLGRALTPDEAREVTHMARRIAALILLQPQLDANYQAVKAATYDWPGSKDA